MVSCPFSRHVEGPGGFCRGNGIQAEMDDDESGEEEDEGGWMGGIYGKSS
jgi:hypothetical protein